MGAPVILQSALYFVLPDLLGCLLSAAVSCSITHCATGSDKLCAKGIKLYKEMRTVNKLRIWHRFLTRLFAFAVLLMRQRPAQRALLGDLLEDSSLPSAQEMFIFSVWFGAVGLVDELHDTVKEVPLHNARVPSWLLWLSYITLLVPIPWLIVSRDVFAHFAVTFAAAEIMGKKLDNAAFKAAVVIGLLFVAVLAWQSQEATAGWPVRGMVAVAFGHLLYEVHDEVSVMKSMVAMGVPATTFAFLCNKFVVVVLAVSVGWLPVAWLCCTSMAYPVAKAGLATGALGFTRAKAASN